MNPRTRSCAAATALVLSLLLCWTAAAQQRPAMLAQAREESLRAEAGSEHAKDELRADEPRQEREMAPVGSERARSPEPYLDSEKLRPLRAVERSLKGFVDFLLPAALTLAGVGVLVMAIIQLLKDLLPTRRWFQRTWFKRRIGQVAAELAKRNEKSPSSLSIPDEDEMMKDLVKLAAAGDSKALFELPVEKLTGQLAAAAQTALDDPSGHVALFSFFAKDASDGDIRELMRTAEIMSTKDDSGTRALMDARSRVFAQMQRTLDAMQIALGSLWARSLKWTSVILGGALICMSVKIFVPAAIQGWRGLAIWILLALLGGFVAPVARDLVAALQSIRSARS